MKIAPNRLCRTRAFTLVELMVVMAIAVTLLAVSAGALARSRGPRRNTAVAMAQGWMERARALAIERGETVYLALPDLGNQMPANVAMQRAAFFRLKVTAPTAPATQPTAAMEIIGEWQSLPDGMVLTPGKAGEETVFDLEQVKFDLKIEGMPAPWRPVFYLPDAGREIAMPCIAFDRMGAMAAPDVTSLYVRLCAGTIDADGAILAKVGGVDRLRLYPSTGRVRSLQPDSN